MNKLRQKLHWLISQGLGQQLLWLCILNIIVITIVIACSYLFFPGLVWQDVVALTLDPGSFSGAGEYDLFRILIALLGCFVFSALLVSVFSNIIDNISDKWHHGNFRYKHKNHIVILGSHSHLFNMLLALKDNWQEDVVVMTSTDVCELRSAIEKLSLPKSFINSVFLYSGERDNVKAMESLCLENCHSIYILGEEGESNPDAASLKCSRIVSELCTQASNDIKMYVMLEDRKSLEVLSRSSKVLTNILLKDSEHYLDIEYINRNEYLCEELLVDHSFMPQIDATQDKFPHFVILGSDSMAKAMAYTLALVAHYPNYLKIGKRTIIDLISPQAEELMRKMIAENENLFLLSHWSLIGAEGVILDSNVPTLEDGDYLDIEWRFYNFNVQSKSGQSYFNTLATEENSIKRFFICENKDNDGLDLYLHIPDKLKSIPVAVYQESHSPLFDMVIDTPFYNTVKVFSPSDAKFDVLFKHRTDRGIKINFTFDKAYNPNPSESALQAWRKISVSHKFSSIYSGSAFCVNRILDLFEAEVSDEILSEMEHRRWNIATLILGYRSLPLAESKVAMSDKAYLKKLKTQFIHPDIAPYDSLTKEDQLKDITVLRSLENLDSQNFS